MFRFLRRGPDNNMRAPGDINGQLMAQYLLALLGREPHGRGDPFAELLGVPSSAQWGDYVFNQEGWCLFSSPPLSHLTSRKHWTKYWFNLQRIPLQDGQWLQRKRWLPTCQGMYSQKGVCIHISSALTHVANLLFSSSVGKRLCSL